MGDVVSDFRVAQAAFALHAVGVAMHTDIHHQVDNNILHVLGAHVVPRGTVEHRMVLGGISAGVPLVADAGLADGLGGDGEGNHKAFLSGRCALPWQ